MAQGCLGAVVKVVVVAVEAVIKGGGGGDVEVVVGVIGTMGVDVDG